MRWSGILSAAIVAALTAPAAADEAGGDLRLTAISYGAIPEKAAFRLQPADDTELNQHVLRQVEVALRSRDHAIRPDAPFVVTIETELAWSGAPDRASLGQIDIGSGLGLSIMVNLWSTTEDSLLGEQPRDPFVDRDYRLALSIHNAEHQRYVWIGEVVDLREGRNPFLACKAMVSALIDAMGETIPARTITLQ